MILRSLKLENIRSYTTGSVTFPEQSMVLSGDTGSGKSTILLAIEFALFGLRSDLSGSHLLRHGENRGSVELHFALSSPHGQSEVRVRRELKRTRQAIQQDAGWIALKHATGEWIKTEATPFELKAKILELLGYPSEMLTKSKTFLYRFTIYTPQEQMKQILIGTESERLDTIRKIFGMDTYTTICANTGISMRELRSRARTAQAIAEGMGEDKEKYQQEQEQLREHQSLLHEAQTLLQELVARLAESRKQVEHLEHQQQQVRKLATQLALARSQHQERQREYETRKKEREQLIAKKEEQVRLRATLPHQDISTIQAEKEKIRQETRQQEDEYTRSATQRAAREEKRRFIQRRIDELEKTAQNPAPLFAALEERQKERATLRTVPDQIRDAAAAEEARAEEQIALIKKEEQLAFSLRTIQESLDQLNRLDQCPLCRQNVAEEHKHSIARREEPHISEIRTALDEVHRQKKKCEDRQQALKEQQRKLHEQAARAEHLTHEIRLLEMQIQDAVQKQREREEVHTAREQLAREDAGEDPHKEEHLRRKLEDQKKHLMALISAEQQVLWLQETEEKLQENDEQLRLLGNSIHAAQEEQDKFQQELKAYEKIEEQHATARARHNAVRAEERQCAIRVAEMEKEVENRKQQLAFLATAIEKKEHHRRASHLLNQLNAWLGEYFMMVATRIEKEVMRNIYAHFDELFRSWFSMLVEDESLHARLNDDFSVIAEQNGYETTVDQLSGGEKTAVALAYRLALNKVINDVVSTIKTKNLIILDEPTDGFSARQLDKLRGVLDELQAQQVVIVSHEQKVESFVDHVIRIEKRGHESVAIG